MMHLQDMTNQLFKGLLTVIIYLNTIRYASVKNNHGNLSFLGAAYNIVYNPAITKVLCTDDDSIQDVVPNDIAGLIESTQIKRIICNGKASYRYYHIYQESSTKIKAEVLPSTSPANAAYSMERLIENWKTIKNSF